MLLCSVCLCLGQLIWKLMPGYDPLYILGGFSIYILGSISMIFAYRNGELSVLQPINSMSFVFASLIGIFILHEETSLINIIGILLIVIGAVVIGRTSR